jgi:dTDP-4-amino-4,6-dideoxygalactose transaminase
MKISFNDIYKSKNEIEFITNSINNEFSYDDKIKQFFLERYNIKDFFLTPSATIALEAIALATNISVDDEVILPSFTLSSTANAFALRGAKLVFADSKANNPNINIESIKKLISPKTKLIVIVHYGGIACEIEEIAKVCKKNNIILVEDAAQAFNSFFNGKALGTFGDFSIFSFHKTKNITCQEGGALIVNNFKFNLIIDNILNKGTNIRDFRENKVSKYEWISLGLSGTMAEIKKAYLYAQILDIDIIHEKRKNIWNRYYSELSILEKKNLEFLPKFDKKNKLNYHLFYIICNSKQERKNLQNDMLKNDVETMFHFNSLHKSIYFKEKYNSLDLPNSNKFSDCLLRLPINMEITNIEQDKIINLILSFYNLEK